MNQTDQKMQIKQQILAIEPTKNNSSQSGSLKVQLQTGMIKSKKMRARYKTQLQQATNKSGSEQIILIESVSKHVQEFKKPDGNRFSINKTPIRLNQSKSIFSDKNKPLIKAIKVSPEAQTHKQGQERKQAISKSNKRIITVENKPKFKKRYQTQQQNSHVQIDPIEQQLKLQGPNTEVGRHIYQHRKQKKMRNSFVNISSESIISKVKPQLTACIKNKQSNSMLSMKYFISDQKVVPNNRYESDRKLDDKGTFEKNPIRYYSVHKQGKKNIQNSTPQPQKRIVIQGKTCRQRNRFVTQHQSATPGKVRSYNNSQVNISSKQNDQIIDLSQGVMSKIKKNIQMKRMGRRTDDLNISKANISRQLRKVKQQIVNDCSEIKTNLSTQFKQEHFQELLNHFIKFFRITQFLQSSVEDVRSYHKKPNESKGKLQKIWKPKKQKFIQLINYIRDYVLQDHDVSCIEKMLQRPQSKKAIKKIIYYERAIILIMVQHLVTEKYQMHENHFNYVIQMLSSQFYGKVFHNLQKFIQTELRSGQRIDNQQSLVRMQAIEVIKNHIDNIKNNKQKNSHSQRYFGRFLESLQNRVNFIIKHSQIQDFLKHQTKIVEDFTSNLLYYNLLQYFAFFLLDQQCLGWNIQFLQTCPSPYIHHDAKKPYTLVLDMDQTLIHYKTRQSGLGQFLLRPHLFQFLQNLSNYYEIGIFTCSLPEYADLILDNLKHIQFRLYRHHCIQLNGQFVKDLSRIGRNLKRTIIVDNLQRNFHLQNKNGIHIKSWYGDKKDKHLKKVESQLIKLAQNRVDNVQQADFCRVFL